MLRTFWICFFVLLMLPLMIFADEQAPSTVEGQRPATENGDTIILTAEEISAMQANNMADVLNLFSVDK